MLEREWVSLHDPDDPHDRYVFDVSFLLSSYACIYGRGCQGIGETPDPVVGCCALGAHFLDADDQAKVEAVLPELGPYMQFHREATRNGIAARVPGGDVRTRLKDGACIFLNREGFATGIGCALHHYAVARGEHPMTHKPEVCWLVPLRRTVTEDVADDGEPMITTTITSYDRGAWGAGGAGFFWWCTDSPDAYGHAEPVYVSMAEELRTMSSPAVYDELAAYLDDRRARAVRPLPFPIWVR